MFSWLAASSAWELAAVILGIAYLLLATWEKIACWYAAFLGTAIYLGLFWQVGLLMEALLQIYYLAMAVYGWYCWRGGVHRGAGLAVSVWTGRRHLQVILAVVLVSFISGLLLSRFTEARLPYLDSFTTWGSLVTTWMVARKLLENWLYWILIDAVSIYMYIDRELYLTAVLFGFFLWRRQYREERAS